MNGAIQRVLQLAISGAIAGAMALTFIAVGGMGPGADDSVVLAKDKNTTSTTSGTSTNVRPGKGCGDKNHDHSGPPGNPDNTCKTKKSKTKTTTTGTTTDTASTTTSTTESTTTAATTDSTTTSGTTSGTTTVRTKPGKGCGDKNHEHSGPPGNPDNKCKVKKTKTKSTTTTTTTATTSSAT